MRKALALKMEPLFSYGPVGGPWNGGFIYQGLSEEGEILFYQRTLFRGHYGRYVKKALETGISLLRGLAGEPGSGLVYRGL